MRRGKKKIKKQRFVMPMRGASFKPGEETVEKQFGAVMGTIGTGTDR
jgi:hypothetical protein